MNIFELVGKLTLEGQAKIKQELTGLEGALEKHKTKLRAVGAAFTAIGAAGLVMINTSKKLNAELGMVGLTLGVSTKEMRNLALATTDVTFSLESVIQTYDLLTRAGMRNTEVIKATAKAFDMLADATGSSAEEVASSLVPAFKVFGIELAKAGDEVDKLTWLTKNTTISLGDFASVMDYVAMYGANLNVTIEDMVGIMAALEAKGMSGASATRLFRTAVSQAKDGAVTLTEALQLTTEEVDKYKAELLGATGITQKYADMANTQFTIMDKIKQKWSELTLKASGFLEPLEPILTAMIALGPAMIFLSTQMGINALLWVKHTIAVIASKVALIAHTIASRGAATAMWLLNAAMSANPFLLVAAAISVVVGALLIFRNRVDSTTKEAIEDFKALATEAQIAFYSISLAGKTMTEDLMTNVVGNISAMFDAVILEINTRKDETIAAMYAVFAGMHTVTEEEIGKTSAFLSEIFDAQTGIYKAYGEEINEIYNTALAENRKTTEAENARINELILLTAQEGIKFTSVGTAQMENLWRQMGENVGEITREMYVSMLWQSEEATKQIVADSESTYTAYEELLKEMAKLGLITGEKQREMTTAAHIETDARIRVAEDETKRLKDELDKRYNVWSAFWGNLKGLFAGGFRLTLEPWEVPTGLQSGETAGLPSLQYGGIVPGAIGRPVPIIAHGGEPFGGVGGAGMDVHRETHIHIGNFLGDELSLRQFTRKLQELMREEERRTAFSGVNTGYFYGGSHI